MLPDSYISRRIGFMRLNSMHLLQIQTLNIYALNFKNLNREIWNCFWSGHVSVYDRTPPRNPRKGQGYQYYSYNLRINNV
jgi:hypothetical protein